MALSSRIGAATLTAEEALAYADEGPALAELCERARERSPGPLVTYSPKVFIPLTHLCRDVCHYCTFARPPRRGERCYLSRTRCSRSPTPAGSRGATRRCSRSATSPSCATGRRATSSIGWASPRPRPTWPTAPASSCVRPGLLPHANPGILDDDELLALREVSASQGIMLETTSARLSERGGPHFGSPDKLPDVRLDAIDRAGRLAIPYTSGILIGIGETRRERVEALIALRDLHERHGHLQEVIVQNFRAKEGTRMAESPEPSLPDHLWTIAIARLVLPLDVAVQAPPNLAHAEFPRLLEAGIDDFGGVSPVTPDHVNPEAPWPERSRLAAATAAAGRTLAPRLPIYPRFLRDAERWLAPAVRGPALAASDGDGLARDEGTWFAGTSPEPPTAWQDGRRPRLAGAVTTPFAHALDRSERGAELGLADAEALLAARGPEVELLARAADARRAERCGDAVSLRGLQEHQLHQRLLLPLRLLRLLQGPSRRQSARARLPPRRRRGGAAQRRGVGPGRHRGLPAGRHPPRIHGQLVPRARARDPRRAASPARARVLAARGLAGRRHRGLGAT